MKKTGLLLFLFMLSLTFSYAQQRLPMPPDPLKPQELMLSRTDLRFKGNAEMALAKGDIDSAVMALNNVRLDWARHWFLSYAYEQVRDYTKALGEIDWLIRQNPRKDLLSDLKNRRAIFENMVKMQEQDKDLKSTKQKELNLIQWIRKTCNQIMHRVIPQVPRTPLFRIHDM